MGTPMGCSNSVRSCSASTRTWCFLSRFPSVSMHATNKFQGPWPPTCIGSVLASPQLLDPKQSLSVDALLFDRHGDPETLLSAKWQKREQSEVGLSLSPSHLLQDNLDYDAALEMLEISKSDGYAGNRLHGVKCPGGTTQLFFPVGDNQDRVGTAVVSSSGNNQPWRLPGDLGSFSGLADDKFVVSRSLRLPILQLTAIRDEIEAGHNVSRCLVAARSLYHVDVLLCHSQEGTSSFDCTAGLEFEQRVSHVAWNPHIYGEAAAVFEHGEVCIFDASINSGKLCFRSKGTVKPTANVQTLYAATERPFWKEQASRREKVKALQKDLNKFKSGGAPHVDTDFWCCEYAWHPRTLFLAGSEQVSLLDFRSNGVSLGMQVPSSSCQPVIHSHSLKIANAACHGYCTQSVGRDHFLAFSRDDTCGMYQFCVASRQHLLLYDVRRPQTPVLQWEHAMVEEPPRLLLMSSLARAPARLNASDLASNLGKVIFAASVQSGDIRAFCYGPQPVTQIPVGDWKSKRKSDIDDVLCAWQLPSKVFAPLQAPDDSSEIFPTSLKDLSPTREKPKASEEGEALSHCVSGLVVLSNQGGVRSSGSSQLMPDFSLVQLSAQRDIIAQKYRLSERLTAGSSNPLPKNLAPVPGNQLQSKTERMPATLNYIREGTVWPAYKSSPDEAKSGVKLAGNGKKRSLLEPSLLPGRHIKTRQTFDIEWSEVQRCYSEIVNDKAGRESQVMGKNTRAGCHGEVVETNKILQHLNSPLGIHEVGRKVVQMELPPGVAQVASGMPFGSEDFSELRSRFPTPLPVLYGEAKTSNPDHREQGFLSADEAKVPEETFRVPLPLLLEVQQQVKSFSKGYLAVEEKTQQEAEDMTKDINTAGDVGEASPEPKIGVEGLQNGRKPIHNFLLERFDRVGQDLERLQHEDSIVSLAESSQSKSHSCKPAILSYRVAPCLPNQGQADAPLDECSPPQSDEPGSSSSATHPQRFDYCRFVAGRTDECEEESFPESKTTGFDQSLCPVKLPYEERDFQLDAYKLEKLKDVEMGFIKWQQAYSPYKTFMSNFGE